MSESKQPDVAAEVYGPSSNILKVLPVDYENMDDAASTGDHLEVPKPQPVPPPSGRRKALLPGSSQNPCNNEEDHGPLVEGKLGAQVLHLNENAAPAANPDVAYQT